MSAENACKSSSSLLFQYIYTLGRSQLSNYWYSICSIGHECVCVCVCLRVVMQCLYIVYGWWLNWWSAVSMLFQLPFWKNTKTKSKQYDNIVYEAENGYAHRKIASWMNQGIKWVFLSTSLRARVCVYVRVYFISFPVCGLL